MSNYHFYDGAESGLGSPQDSSTRRENQRGSDAYILIAISSIGELRRQLDSMLSTRATVGRLLVETHGSAGAIYFGKQQLCTSNLGPWLAGRGYEDMFEPGARVLFNGCNVAEGRMGREFLRAIGRIFFKKNFGSVAGLTSAGIVVPFGGRVYHLWGDLVEIYFGSGGRIIEEYCG
jgi:hypothetical protein